MKLQLFALALLILKTPACAAPSYVSTFHSIGLYWAPPSGSSTNTARVEFSATGTSVWRRGLAPWFDARNRALAPRGPWTNVVLAYSAAALLTYTITRSSGMYL